MALLKACVSAGPATAHVPVAGGQRPDLDVRAVGQQGVGRFHRCQLGHDLSVRRARGPGQRRKAVITRTFGPSARYSA